MYNQAIQEEKHFALNPLQKHTKRRTSTRCCKNTQMWTSSKCGLNLVEICSVSSECRAAIRQSAPTTSQTLDQARVSTTGTIFVLFTLLFLQERVCYKLINTFSEVNYNFVASRSIDGVYIHQMELILLNGPFSWDVIQTFLEVLELTYATRPPPREPYKNFWVLFVYMRLVLTSHLLHGSYITVPGS